MMSICLMPFWQLLYINVFEFDSITDLSECEGTAHAF